MVLDYLDQQRDAPDRELLDRLKWSEDDLRRFTERWKHLRDAEGPSPEPTGPNRQVEESLRSLGIRPPQQATTQQHEEGDSLRRIRDAGGRQPAPPAYRDAFDSFRRAVGRM